MTDPADITVYKCRATASLLTPLKIEIERSPGLKTGCGFPQGGGHVTSDKYFCPL
jgi:hypothetical protein